MTSRTIPLPLRIRLLFVMLPLIALPALLIGALAYWNARQTVEARVTAQLVSIADFKQQERNNWLDHRTADVRLLADNFLIQEHFTEILDPTVPSNDAAHSPDFSPITFAASKPHRAAIRKFTLPIPAGASFSRPIPRKSA